MLDYIINNPNLDKYVAAFETGQTVFLEGDDSQDIYILIEGKADILKGTKKIAEISNEGPNEGSIFGEMSFLLGGNRTATVKAASDLKVIKIPKEEISTFLSEFPEVVRELARYLAKRLDETSQILYGLKEFCDQLPDAVILTDKEGKILSWNRAAENLYGREEDQMLHKPAKEIYEDPSEYKSFLEEVVSKYAVSEKTLRVRNPKDGVRQVSTSTTVLYDGQHNFQGILSLGRDVTRAETLAKRYQQARYWVIPLFILLFMLSAGIFFGYPYFSKGCKTKNLQKQNLKDDLSVNYSLLRSLLAEPFEARDRDKTSDIIKRFINVQRKGKILFKGLMLLGKDKRVFDAYSILPCVNWKKLIGSSYSGIDLGENDQAPYRVLTLYREHKDYPMGIRHTEIVFGLYKNEDFIGWLVFQVDMELLKNKYDVDENDLKSFRFEDLQRSPNS